MEAVLETVQDIAKTLVADRAADVDHLVLWSEQGIRALQQAGLVGMAIPREFGGLGQDSFAVAQTCEILGQECASTAMCFGMHLVGSAVLSAKATPDQQVRYLQPIIEGRHLATLSLSESGTGSQFYIPRTRLDAISPDSTGPTAQTPSSPMSVMRIPMWSPRWRPAQTVLWASSPESSFRGARRGCAGALSGPDSACVAIPR